MGKVDLYPHFSLERRKMIGIIVTSHGPSAQAIIESVKLLYGNLTYLEPVVLLEDDSPEVYRTHLDRAIENVDNGEGIIILVDIPGGTPCNQALLAATTRDDIQIISGFNTMMLLQILLVRSNGGFLAEIAESAIDAGITSIKNITTQLRDHSNVENISIDEAL